MLPQCVAMLAMKLWADDKITSSVQNIFPGHDIIKFQIKYFVILEKLNFELLVTHCFSYELLIGPQPTFLECIVIYV